jgi:hypothetical protein
MNEQLLTWVFNVLVLVWKMRRSQIAFYKNGRKQADLIEAKQREVAVDKVLKQSLEFKNGEPVALVVTAQENEPTQERLL